MTFSLIYAYAENYVLPISHDEVVHGKGSLLRKMPGDRWQQLANLRAYLAYMWAHPGKQLLFMGSEFGQESEWAESRELDWWLLDNPDHRGVQSLVRDLNRRLHARPPALWSRDTDPGGLRWIDANDAANNVFIVPAAAATAARAGLRRELLGGAARRLPDRPAVRRPVGRGAQHRRRGLRRSGVGNFGGVEAKDEALARPARVGDHPGAAAGHGLAAPPPS